MENIPTYRLNIFKLSTDLIKRIFEKTDTNNKDKPIKRREVTIAALLCMNKLTRAITIHFNTPQYITNRILRFLILVTDNEIMESVCTYIRPNTINQNLKIFKTNTLDEAQALDILKERLVAKGLNLTPEKIDEYFKLGLGKTPEEQIATFIQNYNMLPSKMLGQGSIDGEDKFINQGFIEACAMIETAKNDQSTELDLSNVGLRLLPETIEQCTDLTKLCLRFNNLTAIPSEIGNLTNLTQLYLDDNTLTALPPEIGNLTNLTKLGLRLNKLTALPNEIGKLKYLTELDLSYNSLTALPPDVGQLTKLTGLDLFNNNLTAIPSEIRNLTVLKEFTLSHNELTSLPPEIGKLKYLGALYLDNNRLPQDEINNIKKLKPKNFYLPAHSQNPN